MNITFDDIKTANEQINTTEIKGKDYAEVNQRIKAFRMVYPQGFIITELLSDDILSENNGVCKFIAEVGYYDENGNPRIIGTGTAQEKENSSFINKTSYIENCETSAVGRALGMAGFGIDTSVASYEEVQNAIEQQNQNSKIDKHTVMIIESLIKETNTDIDKLLNNYKAKNISELTVQQGNNAIAILNKKRLNND